MLIVIRYVNKCHVTWLNDLLESCMSTKQVLYHLRKQWMLFNFFLAWILSISNLRGQRYDEASNMQGEFNGFESTYFEDAFLHSVFFPSTSISSYCCRKKTC